jgi:DNA polymerase V
MENAKGGQFIRNGFEGAGCWSCDARPLNKSPFFRHVVVALLNNEPVCKRLCKRGREVVLLSENPKFPARYVLEGDELSIWGVITSTVRSHV